MAMWFSLLSFVLISASMPTQALLIRPRGISQCAGHDDAPLRIISGSLPEVIKIPSTVSIDTKTIIRHDLPKDLVMKLSLKKLEPFVMDVPCLDGLGSCEYDICKTIVSLGDSLCHTFPPTQPCSCPILEGELDLKGIPLKVPDFGSILSSLMKGKYDAQGLFYSKSDPDRILGCVSMTFTFETA